MELGGADLVVMLRSLGDIRAAIGRQAYRMAKAILLPVVLHLVRRFPNLARAFLLELRTRASDAVVDNHQVSGHIAGAAKRPSAAEMTAMEEALLSIALHREYAAKNGGRSTDRVYGGRGSDEK